MTREPPSQFCIRPYNMPPFSVVAHMDVFWLIRMLEKFSCIIYDNVITALYDLLFFLQKIP